jgi:penicillin-binding protein 1A
MTLTTIKFIFNNFLKLFFGAIFIIFCVFFYYSKDLPSYDQLEQYYPPSITRIYSADGKLIEEYAKEKRVFVPINSMPKHLIHAFIAGEDKNFYTHSGIDFLGVIRASAVSAVNILVGKRVEGASTITQQVVKNLLLTPERSLTRKIKEAILSVRISHDLSKDQILELYLNQIFLGKGSYGVAIAAVNYFNKSLEELTLSECALLASLPKAPSKFNPEANYERAFVRKNYIIDRMFAEGYISAEEANSAKEEKITLRKKDKVMIVDADYYASKVRQEVISMFSEEYFYNAGLTIITCLDSKVQENATNALRFAIKKYDMKRGYRGPIVQQINIQNWLEILNKIQTPIGLLHYKLAAVLEVYNDYAVIGLPDGSKSKIYLKDSYWAATNLSSMNRILKIGQVIAVEKKENSYFLQQIPDVNGGFMVMDHRNGRVLAVQGGYDFDSSNFDRVTQAKRQVGSLIKPFVYMAGLEKGLKPNDIITDEPIEIYQGPNMPIWAPRNFERDFIGPMTVRKGLEKSRNIITVKVGQFAGLDAVRDIIIRFGVNPNPPHFHSVVLGALETTLSQMVNAFGQIANGGYKIEPHYIEMIKDRFGNILYKRDYSDCQNCISHDLSDRIELPSVMEDKLNYIIDSGTNYQMISLLKGSVERGTSASSRFLKLPLAGKTGTTNEAKDTWFIGFTPEIVAGTYIGYDNPRSLGNRASGATVALPAFIDFMQHLEKKTYVDFKIPNTIYLDKIDPNTGEPSDAENAIIEAFKRKVPPNYDQDDITEQEDKVEEVLKQIEDENPSIEIY